MTTGAFIELAVALALIVGALILFTFWFAIVPVIMLEGKGVFGSFGRSRELVRGNFWGVFGLILITIVILIGVGILVGLVASPLPDGIETYVSDVVSGTLTAPFLALALTLAYYRLRGVREPAVDPAAAF